MLFCVTRSFLFPYMYVSFSCVWVWWHNFSLFNITRVYIFTQFVKLVYLKYTCIYTLKYGAWPRSQRILIVAQMSNVIFKGWKSLSFIFPFLSLINLNNWNPTHLAPSMYIGNSRISYSESNITISKYLTWFRISMSKHIQS